MKKLTLVTLALFVMAGCNPKKNAVKANVATISGVTVGTQCTSTNQNSNVGTIYGQAMSLNFEQQVKALLSATTNPSDIGSISPNQSDSTGVRFSGRVKLDAAGNVVATQSKVTITIYDSYILMDNTIQPVILDLDPSAAGKNIQISGQFNTSSGDGFISIRDQYGEIRFQGRIDAERFSGTVTFANTQNVTGGQPASGTLGQFWIQRCSFLQ
jgi:hypothetical protein